MNISNVDEIINDLIKDPKYSCDFCKKLFVNSELNLYQNQSLKSYESKIICNKCLKAEKKKDTLSFLLSISSIKIFLPDEKILDLYTHQQLDEAYNFFYEEAEKIWESNGSVNKKILMQKIFFEYPEKIPKSEQEFNLIRITLDSIFCKYDNGAFEDEY